MDTVIKSIDMGSAFLKQFAHIMRSLQHRARSAVFAEAESVVGAAKGKVFWEQPKGRFKLRSRVRRKGGSVGQGQRQGY